MSRRILGQNKADLRRDAWHRNDKSNAVLAQKASENTVPYFGRVPYIVFKKKPLVVIQEVFFIHFLNTEILNKKRVSR